MGTITATATPDAKTKQGKPGWIADTTINDHKGGSTLNEDKYQHWFNPYNRTYALKLP